MNTDLYPRAVDLLISEELLTSFPAVLVVGPRGCGKSTSLGRLADTTVDLSQPGIRLAATEDPDGVVGGAVGTVLIDEWQEAPEILGAVKRAVDGHLATGATRFVIAGSVRARNQAATWPGTGRMIRVRMYGLTQAEQERNAVYNPVDVMFDSDSPKFESSELSRGDYLDRIVAGRFPSVIALTGRSRSRWFSAYVEQLVDRDAQQVSSRATRPAKLRAVLNSCVARTGQELNQDATAKDAGVDYRTAEHYIGLLEDLSVTLRVPAWHTKRLKRLTQAPKVHVTDPGMASHLLNLDAKSLGTHATLVGQMLETFVATELAAHIETARHETGMYHFRDRDGREVDVVLEQAGSVVGLEVKSSTSVDASDAKGLVWLRDKLGEDFRYGAVLYSGSLPFQLGERIWALPISSLWRPPRDS